MKTSKRLKHLQNNYKFFIKTNKKLTGLEKLINDNIINYVKIDLKYLDIHKKEKEIKKIETKIDITSYNDGYLVDLNLHIHHYTKLYFDENEFIYNLISFLNLEAGSINILQNLEYKTDRICQKIEPEIIKEQVIKTSFI
jgi:hypothetical protein